MALHYSLICTAKTHEPSDQMAQSEEDEWEYEYDENETEDFYIPIDLANVPSVQGALGLGGPAHRGQPRLLANKLRAIASEIREAGSNFAIQTVEDAGESVGELQIIGLHTENPLMMYNDQLLSCEWNQTIGTDLIFAKPGGVVEEEGKALRSLPSVDLVAMSSARLVARVAQMRPRDDLFDGKPEIGEQSSTEAMESSRNNESVAVPDSADGDVIIPDAPTEDQSSMETRVPPVKPASSSFLGQLNALKARRGEQSRLVLSNAPGGARLIAAEEGAATTAPATEDTTMGGT